MKHYLVFLLGLVCMQTAFAQTPASPALTLNPKVKTGKLSNGLTYFILPNKRPEKRMELRLAVNTGSSMEDDNQQGLAHLVEHMAFNGTKNFKKQELVDYLESIGTKFGPHLNAFTSFDETVYMMQVPTDSPSQFNKAFLILEDWASGLSFDPKEIDKERGVVIEEWRLGQGAQERMQNKYWPILFKGSRYADRLPIGKKEILETAPYERLTSFYHDWYRPDNMAVIAIGDFDANTVEEKIKAHFSKLTNPAGERKVQEWEVPDQPGLDMVKVTDKEAPYTMIEIVYKHPAIEVKSEADYREMLVRNLYNGMLNSRLDELQNNGNPPFSYAYTYYGNIVRKKDNYTSFAMVMDKGIERGLETLVDENERVLRYGFTKGELDRQKKEMMRNMEKQFNERDKTESGQLTWSLVYYFLEHNPAVGPEKGLELYKKYLEGISLEEVNTLAKTFITPEGKNCVVIIQAPEKEGVVLPSDEKIRSIFTEAGKKELKPYEDKIITGPLLPKMPAPGKIISQKTDAIFGYTEMKLSNGATVVYKKTNFKNDEIQFRATSWGGLGLYPESDDMSGSMAGGIISQSGIGAFDKTALDKYLKGKIVSIYPFISETSENLNGRTTPQDLDLLGQLIYLHFTAPRKDENGYQSIMQQYQGFIENRKLDPENAYEDTIEVTMSSYNFRRRPYSLEVLNETKLDRAFDIYKDRFADAGDFTFFFVGNVTDEQMKAIATQYLAALPTTGRKESWKDVGITTPKGKINKTVKRGIEPKSTVTMKFTGPSQYSGKENMEMKCLMKLMEIKLREMLREEKSGTYGVRCYGNLGRIPKQEYTITISFGCGPQNADSLTLAAYDVIASVKKIGCDQKDLTKIKETFRRERETNLKENNWWLGNLQSKYTMNDPLPDQKGLDTFLAELKPEDLSNTAKKYFNMDNYGYFLLLPEK